jgi:superfamily II DNA or RNA helicase
MREHGIEYRAYQVKGRDLAFGEWSVGIDSTLVVLPTGCGKTVLAGMCSELALNDHGRRTLFVVNRDVLCRQAFATYERFGFDSAVEMGDRDAFAIAKTVGMPEVVVGSVQSLQGERLLRWNPNDFGLVIFDEAHHAAAPSYQPIIQWFADAWKLGLTATPDRGDELNLGNIFRTKAYEYPLREAIKDRWLVRPVVRKCPVEIDLRGLRLHGGDYTVGELDERIGPKIEMLARGFKKEIGDRPAVAFLPCVGSAMGFAEVLNLIGVSARYVAGTGGDFGMSKAEKHENLEAFDAGAYQVVVCCELLFEGWDSKRVRAVGNVRPTRKRYRFAQMVGRGLRPDWENGKEDCLVVDYDWQTDDPDCRDLCASIELFDDGTLDPDVIDWAKFRSRQRNNAGLDSDAMKLIEEAEKVVGHRRKFGITLTGKEAKYKAYDYDPIGVSKLLDIPLNRKYDLDRRGSNPASDKQIGMLRYLGVKNPDGLSKWGASKLIDKLQKRREKGLSSPDQVKKLLVAGVDSEYARAMTSESARAAIQEIEAIAPLTQGTLF